MKTQQSFIVCHDADLGTVDCELSDCPMEWHPAILFNRGRECEIGIAFTDFAMIEAFARGILFNLAEQKLHNEGCDPLL